MTTSITSQGSPTLLILCVFLLLLAAVSVFIWGKKLPGRGSWMIWASIVIFLVGAGWDSGVFTKEGLSEKIWMAGWIGAREEIGAITVGVFQDVLGISMSVMSVLMAAVLLLNVGFLSQEPHSERVYAGIGISAAGVGLAWLALTPWLVFGGLVLSILGGFISLGSRWDSNAESNMASQFIWQRILGFLLAFFGACILVTSRHAIFLNATELWLHSSENIQATWIGTVLVTVGLFLQLQPFPFLGWVVSQSESYPPLRVLLTQIFPAWAAFSLFFRLHSQLLNLGLFPHFGWIALFSSILAVFTGLTQKHWQQALGAWLSAGFSVCMALLAFNGPRSAIGMLLGLSLGALCFSNAGAALEYKTESPTSKSKRAQWVKTAAFLGIASGTGMIGFVSAAGGVRWVFYALDNPALLVTFLFVIFMFALLGWKLIWSVVRHRSTAELPMITIVSLFIWIVFSLGFLWTGSITGGMLLNNSDSFFPSLLDQFFGAKLEGFSDPNEFFTASGLYWGVLILAFSAAYWMSGRKEDKWVEFFRWFPKTSKFLANGYHVDRLFVGMNSGIVWMGAKSEKIVDIKLWNLWLPRLLFQGVKSLSDATGKTDIQISQILYLCLGRLVGVPAKILQLIQGGDLRWYLFFALSSGFALLFHYLNV